MKTPMLTILALALAGAAPARAAEPAGMTPEQQKEFNRIAVKTEAMEDWRDGAGLKGFKISGYMDPTYTYNFNKERGTFQFLVPNATEPYGYDNSYFGSVALDVVKETDSGAKFHLTLIPVRSIGEFIGSASIVHEASVSLPVEAIDGKVFFGQVPDWSGYEYLPPTQNKLITHNLLFDFTLPYAYTGVGIEKPVGKWVLKGMVAQVNAPLRQLGEQVPVFVCRGDYTGGEFWGLGFACLAGKKTNLHTAGKDTLALTAEVDGWYTRGDVTLNAHVTYGQQDDAAVTDGPNGPRRAQWAGISALAAYKFTPRLEGIVRGDFIYNQKNGGGLFDWTASDPTQGVGPDPAGDQEKGADRYAVTVGLGYAFDPSVVWKIEYRYDGATKKVFGNKAAILDRQNGTSSPDAKYKNNNSLVSTSFVFSF